MREACCSIVSALVFKLLFVFFTFEFVVVGATLGAFAGTVIGWINKRRWEKGMIIGVVSGVSLSYKLTKAASDYLHSDDGDELDFTLHVVKIIAGDVGKIIHPDEHKIMGFNKAPFGQVYSLEGLFCSLKHCHAKIDVHFGRLVYSNADGNHCQADFHRSR